MLLPVPVVDISPPAARLRNRNFLLFNKYFNIMLSVWRTLGSIKTNFYHNKEIGISYDITFVVVEPNNFKFFNIWLELESEQK